jgi:hypothetical protein
MSALGHSRRFEGDPTSAMTSTPDISLHRANRRAGLEPEPELFDHLVGAAKGTLSKQNAIESHWRARPKPRGSSMKSRTSNVRRNSAYLLHRP